MSRWLESAYLGCLWLLVVPVSGALAGVTATNWHDCVVRVSVMVLLDTLALSLLGGLALYLIRRS